jgi:phosphate starvation-inducible protein PhoH and related proteins
MSKKIKNKKNDVLLPDAVLSTPQTTAQKSGLRGVYLVGKNQSQKDAIKVIESHDVSILYGVPGSGKSHIAMAMGLKELMEGKYERMILTRPYVEAGESMGYLPGGINAKIAPFIYPLMEIASDLCGNGEIVMKFINAGNITIMPFAYMRGCTFKKCFVVADEMQNSTIKQTRLMLTRLGEKSKLVMTGDTEQSDLQLKYEENGLTDAVTRLRDVPEIGFHRFDYDANVRSELVNIIEKKYRKA